MNNANFQFSYYDKDTHNLLTIYARDNEVTFNIDGESGKGEIAGRMDTDDFWVFVSNLSIMNGIGPDVNELYIDDELQFEEAEDNDIYYNCDVMNVRLHKTSEEENVTATIVMHSHSLTYYISMPSSKLMDALNTINALCMTFKEEQ